MTILCQGLRGVICAVDRSSLELLSKLYASTPFQTSLFQNPGRGLLLEHPRIFSAYYEVNLLRVSNHNFHAVSRDCPECPFFPVIATAIAQPRTVRDSSNLNQISCARSALYMRPLGCTRRVAWTYFPSRLIEAWLLPLKRTSLRIFNSCPWYSRENMENDCDSLL